MAEQTSRDKIIIRTSITGILANLLLAAFKAVVGIASNSVAIVMDAVNNISDAASSVITIVGTKLAARQPDKKHPFGYGRIEYLSAMVISLIVLYAGVTAFVESFKKIIEPQTPDYSTASLIIVAAAVVVKIVLGQYVKGVGEKVSSDSLINSGEDARLDSVISLSTLATAGIYLLADISVEAWLGAVIAIVIIRSGLGMLKETLSKILGEGFEASLAREIKATVCSFPEVKGAFDLVLHNYGPDAYQGSVHIEVPDSMRADEIDRLTRNISAEIFDKFNIAMTAISVYSFNTKDPEAASAREKVSKLVMEQPHVLQMHGFFIDSESKMLRFDVVVSFDAPDRAAVHDEIQKKVSELFPGYTVNIVIDADYSE